VLLAPGAGSGDLAERAHRGREVRLAADLPEHVHRTFDVLACSFEIALQ
jgi:hypothetical protein